MILCNYVKWFAKTDYLEFFDAGSGKFLCLKYKDIHLAFYTLMETGIISSVLEEALYHKLVSLEYIEK